ncbi:MAG TPA: pyridoxamine 5'-phosphate oxidase family protein [Chitinophagaceae bacterium]|nr:pyridoxamine 5'-phosphate oxidase family protein [Chitinophagaceae bacterium]
MGLLTAEIKDFVTKTKLGFIATVCPDGTPNLSPKGTTIVWDEDHLAFADIHSPGTVKNLLDNPAIEINVVDVFIRKGYRFKGTAKVFSDGEIFNAVISFFGEPALKYNINNIVLVNVDRVLQITSPIYDTGLPEDEVKNKYIAYWNSVYPK